MPALDLSKVNAAESPEDRASAATAVASQVTAANVAATFEQLLKDLGDKGKKATNTRAGALCVMRMMLTKCRELSEPYIAANLPAIIEASADKMKPVSVEADLTAKELVAKMNPHGLSGILAAILAEGEGKWQSNLLRAELLGALAKTGPRQMQRCLEKVVPVLSGLMWDTKAQVKAAATDAIKDVFACDTNTDLTEFVPGVINCILKPEDVPETVHKLAGVVFVQEVFGSSLAIMAPLLKRGLDEPATATKRNCARIIENMAKLVDDPYEVEPFIPLLLPTLERAKEEVSDPECRTVCEKAHEQLTKTSKKPPVWAKIDVAKVLRTLEGLVGKAGGAAVARTADLAYSLLDLKNLKPEAWTAALKPILAPVVKNADKAVAGLLEQCAKSVRIEEAKEEADDAEQLCDCQFSLAYGNKVLLNQTTLKLKRGYRYGLCGKNDSGKTSLMRAIADGQLEEQGFPSSADLRTMFVETDVQGECNDGSERLLSELSVLEFVSKHAGLEKYGVTPEECREKLLAVGFAEDDSTMAPASLTKLVGRLSGGWRMKCALTRAMLMKADILLLDEPTNHLDPGNVKWVIDYLTSLTHVTSIIVSHDIKVLDQVCTHVLQIDNLKLKQYKGNLTYVAEHFCPDLMSYFQLKATKFTMRFPTPGNLEGITSKGKHIMKMTNISFTYPGAPKA